MSKCEVFQPRDADYRVALFRRIAKHNFDSAMDCYVESIWCMTEAECQDAMKDEASLTAFMVASKLRAE